MLPDSYMNQKHLVNMEPARSIAGSTLNASGEVRNANYFWRELLKRQPEMFSKGNRYKIEELGLSPKVDPTWIKHNPKELKVKSKELDDLFDRLGGIVPAVGDEFDPLSKKKLIEVESKFDCELPTFVVDNLRRFGAFRFNEYVYYTPEKPFPKWYSKTNRGVLDVFFGKRPKRIIPFSQFETD